MKSPIHQMYCTHCTFGTSALEQREGDIAERVLGYSARAASMEREELRKVYRQVERYLYYSLPSDAPSEEKLRLDAELAPRRFLFMPSLGGLQVLGQVSYRQKDTSRNERVGSYFGHLLLAERGADPWPVLDCLKLWGAPWVDEDSDKIPFRLKTLSRLEGLLVAPRPAIDDKVLVSFLTAAPGQEFDDPQKIIPSRWKKTSRSERATLLVDLLQAYLELGATRRESVLVVVEPSVAALLFYGVARLLPEGKLREDISFSTFEPDPDRLPTALAATMFHDPEISDLKPEAYRRGGYVINTFRNTSSTVALRSKGVYAKLMVGQLVSGGVAAVDGLLTSFEAAAPQRPEDLDTLAEAHALLPALFDARHAIQDLKWRQSRLAEHFLSHEARRVLAAESANSTRLKELAGGPNAMLLADLVAGLPDSPEAVGLRSLLRYLPVERFPDLLSSERIAMGHKAEVLAAFIHRHHQFPANCPQLWNGGSRNGSKVIGSAQPRLLSAVLAKLDKETLKKVQSQIPSAQVAAYLIGLVQAGKLDPGKQPLIVHALMSLDDSQLSSFLGRYADELRPYYPKREPHLAARLGRLLEELPTRPERLVERLGILHGWTDFFQDPPAAKARLDAWNRVLHDLQGLQEIAARAERDKSKTPEYLQYDAIGKRIADSLRQAMPAENWRGPDHAQGKIDSLRVLGRSLLGREDFLPEIVWRAMRKVFQGGLWDLLSEASSAETFSGANEWRASQQRSGIFSKIAANPILALGILASVLVLGMMGAIAWKLLVADNNESPPASAAPHASPAPSRGPRQAGAERSISPPANEEQSGSVSTNSQRTN